MSIIGLVSAIILLLVVLAFIMSPLLMRANPGTGSFSNRQRERALTYYERVLRNIRDLDDDLATGKIIQEEYEVERERWMARGVQLLQMLEQLDSSENIVENVEADDADIDAAIEQVIAGADQKTLRESVSS